MKRITCLLIALVMCLSLAVPVFATEAAPEEPDTNVFVPSIGAEQDHPVKIAPITDDEGNEAIGVIRDEDGNVVDYMYDNDDHGCLLITPIAYVWDEEKEVPADVERLLKFVYNELNVGDMEIPYEKHGDALKDKNMVIRDLFDARWACEEHRQLMEGEGKTFEIKFDLHIDDPDVVVYAMSYDEATDEWTPIVKTVNNGDGTVTCTFEHLCAIEFSVEGEPVAQEEAEKKEEEKKSCPWLWILLLVLIVVAIIVIIIVSKKNKNKSKKTAA